MKEIPPGVHLTHGYQFRNCGKCSKCKGTNERPHGPYIYVAYRHGGKLRTGYKRAVMQDSPPRTCTKCGIAESKEMPFKRGSQCNSCVSAYRREYNAKRMSALKKRA